MSVRTRVLCNWQPRTNLLDESEANQILLGIEFQLLLATFGYQITIQSVHSPGNEWKGIFYWHQDCGGLDAQFILWSNVGPTEVRFLNGDMLAASDGDILLIDNREVEHRTRLPVPPGRWLVRSDYEGHQS